MADGALVKRRHVVYNMASIACKKNADDKNGGHEMIYTKLTNLAMCVAYEAHHGKRDRSDVPYVFHPYHLAEQMDTEYEVLVALLHDVVEDSELTLEDLRQDGFPEEVVEAVRLLTHEEGVPYLDYVAALKDNPLAKKVKIADLRHNSDVTRLGKISEKTAKRVKKYAAALHMLESEQA